jgi:hypothetical protein
MKILAEATIAGALGFTAFGLGAGIANANPPSPVAAGIPWPQDHEGHGGHWGGGGGDDNGGNWGNQGDWGGGNNWGGPGWNGPIGCISGPVGWGNGFLCI